METFLILLFAVLLAFIPASMAKKKGYSYGGFWFFGFLLWLPAIIVAACLSDKTKQNATYAPPPQYGYNGQPPYGAPVAPPPPYGTGQGYAAPVPQPAVSKPQAAPEKTCPYCGSNFSADKTMCDSCGARM